MFTDWHWENVGYACGIVLLLVAIFSRKLFSLTAPLVMILYAVGAGFRPLSYNSDTISYVNHISRSDHVSLSQFVLHERFEPFFSSFTWMLTPLFSAQAVLISVNLIASVLFVRAFQLGAIHPVIQILIFVEFFVVGSTSIIRFFLAASIVFFLSVLLFSSSRGAPSLSRPIFGYFIAAGFHLSSVFGYLAWAVQRLRLISGALALMSITLFVMIGLEDILRQFGRGYLISHEVQSTGLRGFIYLFILLFAILTYMRDLVLPVNKDVIAIFKAFMFIASLVAVTQFYPFANRFLFMAALAMYAFLAIHPVIQSDRFRWLLYGYAMVAAFYPLLGMLR